MTGPASSGLWRDARFRRYWAGQSISELGDRVSELALPLLALTVLDARPVEVGALIAAIWLPNLVSVFVGTWVDRLPAKRRALIVANVLQAGAILAVPLAYAADALSMGFLYCAAGLGGAGGVLYGTAYPTFFVRLVRPDQYMSANSLLSGTRSASFIVGPPLAGVLIRTLTAPLALIVDGCSFLLSALLISRVDIDEPTLAPPTQEGYHQRLHHGIAYLRHHPYLRATLACSTTLNLCSFLVQAVVLVYATRTLDLDAASIGLALGIGATGALAGAGLTRPITRVLGAGPTIAAGAVLFSLPFALLPLAQGATLSQRVAALAAVELVSGFGVMLYDITNNSLQTAVTDDGLRARVSGAYSTANYGIRPLGALLGGWTAEHIGTGPTMTAAAIAGTFAVLWLIPSPVLRTRRTQDLQPHPPTPAPHP